VWSALKERKREKTFRGQEKLGKVKGNDWRESWNLMMWDHLFHFHRKEPSIRGAFVVGIGTQEKI